MERILLIADVFCNNGYFFASTDFAIKCGICVWNKYCFLSRKREKTLLFFTNDLYCVDAGRDYYWYSAECVWVTR